MSSVITVENLSKKYIIGHQKQERYTALRDVLANGAKRFTDKLRHPFAAPERDPTHEEFWALKDVSFDIQQGDRVGIIGRNGAGKSTLLKVLSRITEPTSGKVSIKGRVASLLEVGTGFHPELTGRENIFLNGAILGMSKAEIKKKFDEIVAFAEVEKFLDTPVKRYSSGMYVRLAFAVAAHLEPEILIVDEVLAVGDAQFQKKCLGKMSEVGKEGRTVLFVSHNILALQNLCNCGIELWQGKIVISGEMQSVIRHYLSQTTLTSGMEIRLRRDRKGNQSLNFTKVVIVDSAGNEKSFVTNGEGSTIRFYYVSDFEKADSVIQVAFNLVTDSGYAIANLNTVDSGYQDISIYKSGYFECNITKLNIKSGRYFCSLFCSVNGDVVDWISDAFTLDVVDGDYYGTGKLLGSSQGVVLIDHKWRSSN
jgi:lipopolysaccharide transport system ATP-binding protein